MFKFKIGDKVRYKYSSFICTINSILTNTSELPGIKEYIIIDPIGYSTVVHEPDLELVGSEPTYITPGETFPEICTTAPGSLVEEPFITFKKGDNVRINFDYINKRYANPHWVAYVEDIVYKIIRIDREVHSIFINDKYKFEYDPNWLIPTGERAKEENITLTGRTLHEAVDDLKESVEELVQFKGATNKEEDYYKGLKDWDKEHNDDIWDVTLTDGLDELEEEEQIITNSKGGKNSKIEGRYDLLPVLAIKEVAKVLEEGAKKYAVNNWKKVPINDHINHAFNHMFKFMGREDLIDNAVREDLAHAATRLLMALDILNGA